MRIAVEGAAGWIGAKVVAEALARGHEVTAIVRAPDGLPRLDARVRGAVAERTDAEALVAAIRGSEAVVSTVRTPREHPELMLPAARVLLGALQEAAVTRLVWIGGTGVLKLPDGRDIVDRDEFPDEWKPVTLAHRDTRDLFRVEARQLDWTYISPPGEIVDGERTGRYRIGVGEYTVDGDGVSRISTEDFAAGIVDLLERGECIREHVTLAY